MFVCILLHTLQVNLSAKEDLSVFPWQWFVCFVSSVAQDGGPMYCKQQKVLVVSWFTHSHGGAIWATILTCTVPCIIVRGLIYGMALNTHSDRISHNLVHRLCILCAAAASAVHYIINICRYTVHCVYKPYKHCVFWPLMSWSVTWGCL